MNVNIFLSAQPVTLSVSCRLECSIISSVSNFFSPQGCGGVGFYGQQIF